jgi:hypothetical protein
VLLLLHQHTTEGHIMILGALIIIGLYAAVAAGVKYVIDGTLR